MSYLKNIGKSTHPYHITIFLLTLITAGAHIYLSTQPDESLRFLFLLNGLGFLGLLVLYLLPQAKHIHTPIRLGFLAYTLLTLILWFVLGSPREGTLDPFDVVVKAVEVTLVIHLFLDSK